MAMMKKGTLVASRLPEDLVRDLEVIEAHEQSDRSTVVRRLLHRAIADWKREQYAHQYGNGQITNARRGARPQAEGPLTPARAAGCTSCVAPPGRPSRTPHSGDAAVPQVAFELPSRADAVFQHRVVDIDALDLIAV